MRLFRKKQINLDVEVHATKPDYVVYVPKTITEKEPIDTGNDHFLVFMGPDGNLMTVWTQSTREGATNQRIVFSKSPDYGKSWDEPKVIAGPTIQPHGRMSSWGYPMVSKSGRIYVIFSEHQGIFDTFFHTTGVQKGIYSDDNGDTWSIPRPIPMPRSMYDNPDPKYPTNIIVWQKPLRLVDDKFYVGFTRWVSKEVRNPPPTKKWISKECVVEFMKFENLDEDPEPNNLIIKYIMSDKRALRVGNVYDRKVSVVQEPSIVKLPDKRLFSVMRTTLGQPYYSISDQSGENWSVPQPLRYSDDGPFVKQPISPCPIYQINHEEYFLLFHNHDGHYKKYKPKDTNQHRRPICITKGRYTPDSNQPITFSEPEFLMDHTGVKIGPAKQLNLAMYSSFTQVDGKNVIWYPDRKCFLLGKILNV